METGFIDVGTQPKRISVLGATGSVGSSTLDLVRRNRDEFQIVALTAHGNADALADLALEFDAELAVIADDAHFEVLRDRLAGSPVAAAAGASGLLEAGAAEADWIMSAIVGAAGLAPTLKAIEQGSTIALANKESLVCAGKAVMAKAERYKSRILPVDSEHNAIFQVLDRDDKAAVENLVLTASGGPFRSWEKARIDAATPAEAVAHPNWDMGAKISVDSASMMNKGLELIEAHHLFALPGDQIEILVHPESIIHSMVQYKDGSLLAQLGPPDMRVPIAHTLAWPHRMETPVERLSLAEVAALTFYSPDLGRFPALRLARNALNSGGNAPPVLNAANEVAVAEFLAGNIGFSDITRVVETVLESIPLHSVDGLEEALSADRQGREYASRVIAALLDVVPV